MVNDPYKHVFVVNITRDPELCEKDCTPHGGDEKVRTATVGKIVYRGVLVESRYSKIHEMAIACHVLDAIHPFLRYHMISIYCDSNQTFDWVVSTRGTVDPRVAAMIFGDVQAELYRLCGGHNGLMVECHDELGGGQWAQLPYGDDRTVFDAI